MFLKEIPVLLVDDEPDVLAVSKLAMRNFTVYGLPLRIYTAESKAEAIEVLEAQPTPETEGGSSIAVVFIDVVMETDTAGLELCQYIRETLGRPAVQLFIRTGQPGVAPERAVIDRYDINGYFTKVEATEDKLYSLVKSGARQAYTFSLALRLGGALQALIAASDSREQQAQIHLKIMERWVRDFNSSLIFEDKVIPYGIDEQSLLELRDRLDKQEGTSLSDEGDKYVVEGNHLLIKVAGSATTAETWYLASPHAPPPALFIEMLYRHIRAVATLWKKAK